MPEQPTADPVPLDQPAKVEPEEGEALKVMDVPEAAVQVPVFPVQLKVQPVAVTVPLPAPDLVTVRVYCASGEERLASSFETKTSKPLELLS